MLKCYYASILPAKKRKTSATLLTSLSCRLFLPASSQLRGSANKSNPCILGHSETIPSALLSWGGSRILKEVQRSDRAFFPFHHPHNRFTHRTRKALLLERKRLHSHCLRVTRHQDSGLKASIQLTAPKWSCTSMPGSLLLLKALLLISAKAQHVSPMLLCWALWPKFLQQ